MSGSGVGVVTALLVANVVRMLDVLGDFLGPVVRRRQMIKWIAGEVGERGQENDS